MVLLKAKIEQLPDAVEGDAAEVGGEKGPFEVPVGNIAILPPEYIGHIGTTAEPTQLAFLRDGRLRVRRPLSVTITQEDGQFVAEAEEINEFGYGETVSIAIPDLQRAIAELYFTLEEDQDRLGPDVQEVWEVLQTKILRR